MLSLLFAVVIHLLDFLSVNILSLVHYSISLYSDHLILVELPISDINIHNNIAVTSSLNIYLCYYRQHNLASKHFT